MLFDSHCHLDDDAFREDLESVLQRARQSGVGRMLAVGTGVDSSRRTCEIARRETDVLAAAGIHPHDAGSDPDIDALRPLLSEVVAIGETGLDYAKNYAPVDQQQTLFVKHLHLARETGLPLVIHCREAHEDCVEILKREAGASLRGVIHCFSGTTEHVGPYLDLGLHLSISGPVTYPKADALREAVRRIPSDRLLVETDAPLLPPQSRRGKRNEPALIREILRAVAEQHGRAFEEMEEITSCNAETLFARS